MAFVQAAAIGLIALILTPGFSFYFDVTPKLVVLLAAAGICCAGTRPAPRSTFSVLVMLSVLSLVVSTALSGSHEISAFGTNWRRYGAVTQSAILLLAWFVSAQAPRAVAMLRIVAAAGAATAIYGIAQYFGWDPILPAGAYRVGEGVWAIVRPPGTLGYASYFATWLLFVIFLTLAIPGRWWKLAAGMSVTAMAMTGTRAAILGLAAGVAVWLLWRGWRVPRRGAAVAVALLAAAAVFYYSPAGWQLRSRARWFAEDPWGGARPLLWRDTLRMAGARPVTGYGPETFGAEFPRYQSAALARAYPDFAHESPHNMFLDALAAQGIPGLALLAGLCAAGFRAAWRARRKHPATASALAAALAAGIVSQQFTGFTIPTATIFFATIALAVGLDSPEGNVRRRSLACAAPGVLLIYLAVRFAAADHALALTQRSFAAADVAGAARHYEQARIPGASSDLWYSRALVRAGQLQPAIAAGVRATRTGEDPFNAWYSLSALYAAQNDVQRAEASLRNAIHANPAWFKPHWTLARLLAMTGRAQEAAREAALAADLDGGKHAEVAATLRQIRGLLQE